MCYFSLCSLELGRQLTIGGREQWSYKLRSMGGNFWETIKLNLTFLAMEFRIVTE
jgi:hypothetical protein